MKTKLLESTVQTALANHYSKTGYSVAREVKTPIGIIDLIIYKNTEKRLIEVKEFHNIKHAIGQIQSYKIFHPDATALEIIYFSYNFKHKNLPSAYSNLTIPSLTFTSAHTIFSNEELYALQHSLLNQHSNKYLLHI